MKEPVKRKLKEQLGWGVTSEIQWCTMLGPVLFIVPICLEKKTHNEVTGFLITFFWVLKFKAS